MLFFMLGMGFEPLFWRSQNETESLPLRRSGRVRIQHAGCRPPLRIRLQIGRRGDYQSPAGSRVQGSAPNAPTVGRGAHTPPLPGWCNRRGTGRNGPGTVAACGHAAPACRKSLFATLWAHIQCAPTDPPMLLSQGRAKCIVSHKKNQQCRFDTADLLFIPLR